MRKLLPLLVAFSCSQPVPSVHSQPMDARPQVQALPTTPDGQAATAPATPAQRPVVANAFSELTGIELQPADKIDGVQPRESEVIQKAFAAVDAGCSAVEIKALRSPIDYRYIDAEGEAFLTDARKIGWALTQIKAWPDLTIYQAKWHAELRVIALHYKPQRLIVGICRYAPLPATKPSR